MNSSDASSSFSIRKNAVSTPAVRSIGLPFPSSWGAFLLPLLLFRNKGVRRGAEEIDHAQLLQKRKAKETSRRGRCSLDFLLHILLCNSTEHVTTVLDLFTTALRSQITF